MLGGGASDTLRFSLLAAGKWCRTPSGGARCSEVLEGTLMAGAGNSNVFLGSAWFGVVDKGGVRPKLP